MSGDESLQVDVESLRVEVNTDDTADKDDALMEHFCPLSPLPCDQDGESINENSVEKTCVVCGVGQARRCTNCKQTSYCGKEHQIEHWKAHKQHCFPVKVVNRSSLGGTTCSNLKGRSESHVLVATRDIKQGEVFFREGTILMSPGPWDSEAIEVAKGRLICVSCCEIIKGFCEYEDEDEEDCTVRCSQCNWPVCNHFCETAKRHSDYECKILSSNRVSSMVLNQMPDYECILVLRALQLRELDPERWMRLLNLDSPVDILMDNEAASLFLNSSVKFVREKCGLKQYSDNLIRQVASICYLNGFCNDDHPGDNGYIYKIATYIGDISSKVAHSCIGNSEWAVITSKEDQIRFRALIPIKAGEVISTAYNCKQMSQQGTQVRQSYLNDHFAFRCSCQRCLDPSEIETYVSAIKCTAEMCTGHMLPLEPANLTSAWTCNSELCDNVETSKKVQDILSVVSQKLEHYPYKDPMRAVAKQMGETKRAIIRLKRLVDKYSRMYMHPNHYLLLDAEWKIMQNCYYYIMNVKQWTPDVVDLLVGIGRKHLVLFDNLSPGLSRRRGYILYFLQAGLLETIRHGTSSLTKNQRRKIKDHDKHEVLKKTYTEMMLMRAETTKIFSFKGKTKNSMEEELVNFSAPDQPFISCLRFLERILDRSIET